MHMEDLVLPPVDLRSLITELRSGNLPLMQYIDQLQAYFEAREPQVLAFVEEEDRFDRLRRNARELLERYAQPETRPPLFGVALGVKDIFHVRGLQTRAGTKVPASELQGEEAAVVTALRKAGALVLGKTVTTEFAYFAPGPTRNPHNTAHTPGGSSSGSAAAVGAGLCPLALGTQTIGSINRPAAFCGVVGFKPSYERISRAGVIPLSPSLDHIGLFTSDVFGMTLVASLVLNDWQPAVRDTQTVLGIPRGPYLERATPEGLAHFETICRALEQAGYPLREVPAMSDFEAIERRHRSLVAAEAARVHEKWFATYDHLYHAKTAALITQGAMVLDAEIAEARDGRLQLRETLAALMQSMGVDLWITPAATGAAPRGLERTGDPVMNLPWTHSGLPSLSLPAGFDEQGLPMGVQVIGGWQGDEAMLAEAERIAPIVAGAHGSFGAM